MKAAFRALLRAVVLSVCRIQTGFELWYSGQSLKPGGDKRTRFRPSGNVNSCISLSMTWYSGIAVLLHTDRTSKSLA